MGVVPITGSWPLFVSSLLKKPFCDVTLYLLGGLRKEEEVSLWIQEIGRFKANSHRKNGPCTVHWSKCINETRLQVKAEKWSKVKLRVLLKLLLVNT